MPVLIDSLYIIVKRGDWMEDAVLIKVFGKLIESLFLSNALKRHCTWYSDTFDIIKLDTGMYIFACVFIRSC